MRTIVNILSYSVLLLFVSCKAEFEPIDYGKEACAHCRMTIVDARFAAEILTSKGKAYKFDDVMCMKQYSIDAKTAGADTKYYVANYAASKDKFIDAATAIYLQNEYFKSPMNGNAAAFLNKEQAKHFADSIGVQPTGWSELK